MPEASSALLSSLVSFLALGVIVLICRWVFSTGHRSIPAPRTGEEDLGLLVPVAEVRTREDAEMLREVLTGAGIRSGVSLAPPGVRVLVFEEDLQRARELVATG